jgi:hypothetical protein
VDVDRDDATAAVSHHARAAELAAQEPLPFAGGAVVKGPVFSRSTYGSPAIARLRWMQLRHQLGDDHPAARAALGRWLVYRKWTPQRGLFTPEAIAWHRESRAAAGYMNRSERRRLTALIAAQVEARAARLERAA